MNSLKICSYCNNEKPITEFFRDKQNKDGFAAQCKICKTSRKTQVKKEPPIVKKLDKTPYKEQTYKRPTGMLVAKGFKVRPVSGITGARYDMRKENTSEMPSKVKFNRVEDMHTLEAMLEDAGATIVDVTPAKVTITGEQENLFKSLSERFDATYTVTVRRDGKTTCQVHCQPSLHFKASTPEALLEKILC